MKKSLILFALAVMCCTMAFAANGTKIGNIYYILDDTNLTATVTWGGVNAIFDTPEYTGSIVIPGSVSYNSNVYQVTSIGEDAFSSCQGLTSVTIPESVTSIGASAFFGDRNLVSANIPLGVTVIEDDTFRGCIALASIVIPGGVTYIGDLAFLNCYALADMYVFAMTPPSVHESAFNGMEKGTTRLYVPDVDVYEEADGWKEFINMTTLDLTFRANAIAAIDAAIEGVTDAAILAIATQAKTEIGQTLTEEQANAIKDKALAKINAFAEIDAAIEGVTDETILAIATQAKTDINAATTVEDVVAIKTLPLAKLNAFAEIEAAIEGVTDTDILAIATQAKTDINAATTVEDVVAIKTLLLAKINAIAEIEAEGQGIQNENLNNWIEGAINDIQNGGPDATPGIDEIKNQILTVIHFFKDGKAEGIVEGDAAGYARGKAEGLEEGKIAGRADALGSMGEPCTDCPSVEVKKDDKTIKLYNPEKVEFKKE